MHQTKSTSAFLDGATTCLLIPTGKLEPLVARLMGATTATRVGGWSRLSLLRGTVLVED